MSIQVETTGSGSKPRRWITVVVSVVVIGAAGLIAQGGSGGSTEVPGTTLARFEELRLDDQVPGLMSALHVILTINGDPTYAIWSPDSAIPDLVELTTPRMQLNADLSLVATINFTRDDGGDLVVGPPGAGRAVSPSATSLVWHESDPTLIAVTRTLEDTSLWLAEINPAGGYSVSSFRSLDPGTEVVAFGEWGFALRTKPDSDGQRSTVVLDPDGEETLRVLGDVVGSISGPSGGVLIADPLSTDVTATWTADQFSIETIVDRERILDAVWSRDLNSYAEFSNGDRPSVDVLYVQRGSDPTLTFEGYAPIVWDRSGRFLAAISARQIVIIDASLGEVYEVGFPLSFVSDVRFGN